MRVASGTIRIAWHGVFAIERWGRWKRGWGDDDQLGACVCVCYIFISDIYEITLEDMIWVWLRPGRHDKRGENEAGFLNRTPAYVYDILESVARFGLIDYRGSSFVSIWNVLTLATILCVVGNIEWHSMHSQIFLYTVC
jgi:hypothetical protein